MPHVLSVIEVGRAFGSMAWVASFLIDHPFLLAHFPEAAQRNVWDTDGPDARIATSFVPVGQVSAADGGFALSGNWSWASGVEHCRWIMLGGLVHHPGACVRHLASVCIHSGHSRSRRTQIGEKWESSRGNRRGGGAMAQVINCECGYKVTGDDEDQLVQNAEAHVRERHPDMAGQVSREQLIGMIEEE